MRFPDTRVSTVFPAGALRGLSELWAYLVDTLVLAWSMQFARTVNAISYRLSVPVVFIRTFFSHGFPAFSLSLVSSPCHTLSDFNVNAQPLLSFRVPWACLGLPSGPSSAVILCTVSFTKQLLQSTRSPTDHQALTTSSNKYCRCVIYELWERTHESITGHLMIRTRQTRQAHVCSV